MSNCLRMLLANCAGAPSSVKNFSPSAAKKEEMLLVALPGSPLLASSSCPPAPALAPALAPPQEGKRQSSVDAQGPRTSTR